MTHSAISVIIPVYNVAGFLSRCVRSVTGQTFSDLEILLIDDGSTDSSGQLCDELARTDSRIRVIHRENGGTAAARNTGIDQARGDYLSFIDSDDFVEADMLESLYALAQTYQTPITACAAMEHFRVPQQKQYSNRVFLFTPEEALENVLLGKGVCYSACNKLLARELCQQHRFPVGKTYEDVRYLPGLLTQVDRIAYLDRPLYHYWHRAGSICSSPFGDDDRMHLEAHEYMLEQVRCHWPELEDMARFRCLWAKLLLLDKMLLSGAEDTPLFRQTLADLRQHWREIVGCPYFQPTRRLVALALRLSLPCYRLLLTLHTRRTEVNDGTIGKETCP